MFVQNLLYTNKYEQRIILARKSFSTNCINNSVRSNKNALVAPVAFKGIESKLMHACPETKQWLQQFKTAKDKKIALKLLDNFVYYSIDDARTAYGKLHHRLLAQVEGNSDAEKIKKVRFFYNGNAKSGGCMAYLYRQINNFRSKGPCYRANGAEEVGEYFYPLEYLSDKRFVRQLKKEKVEHLAIIDDVVFNGDSYAQYFTPKIRNSFEKFDKIFSLTLVGGNKKGIERLKYGDKLRGEPPIHNYTPLWDKKVLNFDDSENKTFSETEQNEIKKWIDKYTDYIEPSEKEKFSRSKSFIVFDWNTPGTTPLPFIYSNEKWKALFPRYNGLIQHNLDCTI
jgi:hypothetical protein